MSHTEEISSLDNESKNNANQSKLNKASISIESITTQMMENDIFAWCQKEGATSLTKKNNSGSFRRKI